jgi:hypothetical protein
MFSIWENMVSQNTPIIYTHSVLLKGWHIIGMGETHTLFWWRILSENGNLEVTDRNGTLLKFTSGGRLTKLARDLTCGVAQTMKAYRGNTGKSPLVFKHGTRWRWKFSRPGRIAPAEITPIPIEQEDKDPALTFSRREKSLCPYRDSKPGPFRLVPSRYTVYVTSCGRISH